MSYQSKEDILKQIRSRIMMINENIRGNINSLSLEGNFTDDVYQMYKADKDKALEIKADVDHLRVVVQSVADDMAAEFQQMNSQLLLKVKKEDVCTQLSIEETGIYCTTKLFLVDTTNFKVEEDGCYLKGTIYATSGEIGGWQISGNSLVGTKDSQGNWSAIDGGTIEALTAEGKTFAFSELDFNPEYEEDYHNVDLSNCDVYSSSTEGMSTSFGELTIHGAVSIDTNLTCGDLHCTELRCQGTSGYNTIYCDEIITNTESWSDRRLKEDIRYLDPEEGDAVLRLRPVTFRYRKDGRRSSGFIAQEVMEALPEYGSIVEERKGYYGISERQLIPLMILKIKQNAERLRRLRDGREE